MERARFEQLALGQMDAVYRLSMKLSRRPEEAEELVQEVFIRAFRPGTIERFEDQSGGADPEGSMRSWLFAICHNVFYTRIKKEGRQPTSVGEFFGDHSVSAGPTVVEGIGLTSGVRRTAAGDDQAGGVFVPCTPGSVLAVTDAGGPWHAVELELAAPAPGYVDHLVRKLRRG